MINVYVCLEISVQFDYQDVDYYCALYTALITCIILESLGTDNGGKQNHLFVLYIYVSAYVFMQLVIS